MDNDLKQPDAGPLQEPPTQILPPAGAAPEGEPLAQSPPGNSSPGPAAVGRYFGKYELLEEIARGGMGVVFKARQAGLNRVVALKMILAGQLAGEADVQRFYLEAQTAANLQHPYIVAIHEVGQQDGQHYFSMDYVEGVSLADLVRDHPLPPRQAARYVQQVADAIHYAHQQGTLHRDLKPSNVLIDRFDQPRVTDFGLARRIEDDQGLTATGAVIGTPSYMPPEQASAERGKLGPATDVYSLGAVLYELVTGRPPFRAATPLDTMLQVLSAEPAPPRALNPALSRDLETIILKCLAKEPEKRYASAGELSADLQAYQEGRPIRARRPGWAERAARWVARHRGSVTLTAAAAAASALLIIGGLLASGILHEGQLGRFQLDTQGPLLIAQVRDEAGNPVTQRFTVPTQEPIALPAGPYRLHLAGRNGLDETYRFDLDRGAEQHFEVDLRDQPMWEPLRVPRSYETVRVDGRTDLLLLSDKGVSRHHGGTGEVVWTVNLRPKDHPALAGFRWDWNPGKALSGRDVFDYRPALVRTGLGGPADDLIWASRRQPALLALSAADGKVRWCSLNQPQRPRPVERGDRRPGVGAVIGEPAAAVVQGTPALITTFVEAVRGTDRPRIRRWVEAVSRVDGRTLWRFELDGNWFKPAKGERVPYACRWHGLASGLGLVEGPRASVMLYAGSVQRATEEGIPVPYAAQVVEVAGQSLAVIAAGTRLVSLDVRTGLPAGPADDLGFWPIRAPRFADLTGPGQGDVLMHRQREDDDHLELRAYSLRQHRPLWQRTVRAEWAWNWYDPPPEWPLITDLEGNGSLQVIVPNGEATPDGAARWAGLEVLDGATGQTRWQHRLVQDSRRLLYPVNRFVVGPDIDRDGCREVFTVSAGFDDQGGPVELALYVDALSGKDGRTLWWFREPIVRTRSISLNDAPDVGPLRWWSAGADGWPQLLVSRRPYPAEGMSRADRRPTALLLSAGTGRLLHRLPDFAAPEVADLDGDGLADLLSFQPDRARQYDAGGRLRAIRGRSPERWQRLGGGGEAGQDYAGEGLPALLTWESSGQTGATARKQLTAISGRDGRRLWRCDSLSREEGSRNDGLVPTPLPQGDLDGDGVPDLLAPHLTDLSYQEQGTWTASPLEAISGKSGKRLWKAGVEVSWFWEGAPLLECQDLEGNGKPQVILAGISGQGIEPETNVLLRQLWLAVLSGRDGQLVWRQPLIEGTRALNLGDYRLRPLITDLDGDGVRDLVVPAPRPGQDPEVRAFSGRDGAVLWELPAVSRPADDPSWWTHPLVAAGDPEGDGPPDVLVWHVIPRPDAQGSVEPAVEVLSLEGSTGRVRWSWQERVSDSYGRALEKVGQASRGQLPLLVAVDGSERRAIAVWVEDARNRSSLVLLDADGHELRRVAVQFTPSAEGRRWKRANPAAETPATQLGHFRVWSHDLDGDGRDELLFFEEDHLKALRADLRQVLWQWKLPGEDFEMLDIRPAEHGRPSLVVVRAGHTVYGLDGATGRPYWRCTGPGLPAAVLYPTDADALPRVTFAVAKEVTACGQACRVGPGGEDVLTAVPYLPTAEEDPRVFRPLPWCAGGALESGAPVVAASLLTQWLLTGGCAVLLLIIPGLLVRWAVRRRSWRLAVLPAGWLALTLALVFLLFRYAATAETDPEIRRRLMALADDPLKLAGISLALALLGLPAGVYVATLLMRLLRQRWRAGLLLVAGALLLAVPIAWLLLRVYQPLLGPDQHFSWRGWYWIGVSGTYALGLLLIGWFVLRNLWSLGRWLWLRSSIRPRAQAA